jgi:hypothetical protein
VLRYINVCASREDKFGDTDENSENVVCVLSKNFEQVMITELN